MTRETKKMERWKRTRMCTEDVTSGTAKEMRTDRGEVGMENDVNGRQQKQQNSCGLEGLHDKVQQSTKSCEVLCFYDLVL